MHSLRTRAVISIYARVTFRRTYLPVCRLSLRTSFISGKLTRQKRVPFVRPREYQQRWLSELENMNAGKIRRRLK